MILNYKSPKKYEARTLRLHHIIRNKNSFFWGKSNWYNTETIYGKDSITAFNIILSKII